MYGPRRKGRLILTALLVLLAIAYFIIELNAREAMMGIARSRAQLEGQRIISQAVSDELARDGGGRDLVVIHKDSAGRVVLVQPDAVKISQMMTRMVLAVEKEFSKLGRESISIPLGQVLGVRMLAGFGPAVKMKMAPAGRISVDILDRFETAGINQTKHLICFKFSGNIKIVAPFSEDDIRVTAVVPIAETIIVSQVPGTYVDIYPVAPSAPGFLGKANQIR